jgi:hypothetical protein
MVGGPMGVRKHRLHQLYAPAVLLDAIRERATKRRVPVNVVLREAIELYLDADERELLDYFDGNVPGARLVRVRAEIVGAPRARALAIGATTPASNGDAPDEGDGR